MALVFHEISEVDAAAFKYAVIVARYRGKWIFVKNKKRRWEIPGGHIEEGETPLDAAKRELYEETGATRFTIRPVSAYRINNYGMLFFAEVGELGGLPESEIERIDFFDDIPDDLSFPQYHPALFERVKGALTGLVIRDVRPEEYQDICRLMNDGLGLAVPFEVLSEQIERIKKNGNYIIKAAVRDNRAVGFVAAYRAMILELPRDYVRIIGLAVGPECRREGIGRRLIEAVRRYAEENGAAYIALNSVPHAAADHAFYEAAGFARKSFGFSLAME